MPRARAFLFWLTLAIPLVRAQEEPLVLDPPLRTAFPLAVSSGAVRVEYPVLLNDHTILRPGAVLRFIYLDPTSAWHGRGGGEGSSDGFHSHIGPGGALTQNRDDKPSDPGRSGAWGNNNGDETAGIFDDTGRRDDAKQRKSELQNEVWTQPDLFRDALDHATEVGTTIVYHLPPQNKPLTASLDLPDGMLLAEENGRVCVLGLSDHSRAFSGGMRAGDAIRSLNGGAPIRTLEDFIREYAATKRQAKITGTATYAMEIEREGQPVSVEIAAPPTIPSFF